jgi:hypothetical protein
MRSRDYVDYYIDCYESHVTAGVLAGQEFVGA